MRDFSVGLDSAIRRAMAVRARSEILVSPFLVRLQSLMVRKTINNREPIRLLPS